MTDDEFLNELWIYNYIHQIDGWPMGNPNRKDFKPIVVFKRHNDGRVNRRETVEMSEYVDFTGEQKAVLLKA